MLGGSLSRFVTDLFLLFTRRKQVLCSREYCQVAAPPFAKQTSPAVVRGLNCHAFGRCWCNWFDDLPHRPNLPDFQAEGSCSSRGSKRPWRSRGGRLAALEKAVEGLKPYLSNTRQDGKHPILVLTLNRAMNRPRPETVRKKHSEAERSDLKFVLAIASRIRHSKRPQSAVGALPAETDSPRWERGSNGSRANAHFRNETPY